MIGRESIAFAETKIRPYIRRTPVIEVAGEDLGLPRAPLLMKLELFQRSVTFGSRAGSCTARQPQPAICSGVAPV